MRAARLYCEFPAQMASNAENVSRMRQLDQDAFYKAPTIYGIYEDWYA